MKAIVTGICGQDGAYLAKMLLDKGYHVTGWARRNASLNGLKHLGIDKDIEMVQMDICDPFHVNSEIQRTNAQEIYNLAAQSHVGMSFKNPMLTCQVNYGGYLNILLAARAHTPQAKIYQAGTSEMFGYASEVGATEKTPFMPMSPYAISKVAAHWAGVNARYEADQHVCNGILFNHESPLRSEDFVTRKITKFIAEWLKTGAGVLQLGNLDSIRDWGHAKDYVNAMYLMMQGAPDDYVVATGYTMSVRKLLLLAFSHIAKDLVFEGVGMDEVGYIDGKRVIEVSSEFYRPNDLKFLKGDSTRARRLLGWEPKVTTAQLIEEMIESDIKGAA